MAGLDDLIQAMALNQKQQTAIAADDPYDDFSALGQQTIQASLSTPGLSSRERIIGAILGGIGGGISQGLSSDYRGRALTAYNDVLSATKNGNEIEQPSVLSPSIFAQAQQDGTIWKQLQADNIAAEAAKSAAQANLKSKDTQEAIKLEIAKGLMSEDPKKRAAAEQLGAAISGIKAPEPEPITKTPYEQELERFGGDRQALEGQAGITDSLRKELETKPVSVKLTEIGNRYDVLKKAMLDPSRITDQDFVYGIAKILDPGSVVRESEGKAVIDSQSLDRSVLGRLNAAFEGNQALDQTTRASLLQLAGRHYETTKQQAQEVRDYYTKLAESRGIDPFRVVVPMSKGYTAGDQDLKALAATFPNTPEGKQAFKAAAQLMVK